MPQIHVLDQQTINQIAAGEVIERPASVVKELVENAIDAGATAVTVEIREGGISLIRITDNGCGMEKKDVPLAFLRHTTSKITGVEDLLTVSSLGFRGEALSSIAAVAQVELITKTPEELTGIRYCIEGGKEISLEEIGAPTGTTFLVRNLFFNTPARRKFLKTPQTEAGYISDLMEHMALSHPEVSFHFIQNGKSRLQTSGNGSLQEIIYEIYGREVFANLIPVSVREEGFEMAGFLGNPLISRGNRNFESYFINGRFIKSKLIARSIEEGYQALVMQHKYPFTVLHFTIDGNLLDVNVHPTKMELRFRNQEELGEAICRSIRNALNQKETIPVLGEKREEKEKSPEKPSQRPPEPFEEKRLELLRQQLEQVGPYRRQYPDYFQKKWEGEKELGSKEIPESSENKFSGEATLKAKDNRFLQTEETEKGTSEASDMDSCRQEKSANSYTDLYRQGNLADYIKETAQPSYRIVGQVFQTYWLVEEGDRLYLIDQHAAHEKVLYERTLKSLKEKELTSQELYPPVLISLTLSEEETLHRHQDYFAHLGFRIEHFGGKEYALTALPDNLFGLGEKELFIEILDDLGQDKASETPERILEKIASLSCKAAVKGNQRLSFPEMQALLEELFTLENPYHCPHGRPTTIVMTKYELEKKFKRIL